MDTYPEKTMGSGTALSSFGQRADPQAQVSLPLASAAIDAVTYATERVRKLRGELFEMHTRLFGEPERGPSPLKAETPPPAPHARAAFSQATQALDEELSLAESFAGQLNGRL